MVTEKITHTVAVATHPRYGFKCVANVEKTSRVVASFIMMAV